MTYFIVRAPDGQVLHQRPMESAAEALELAQRHPGAIIEHNTMQIFRDLRRFRLTFAEWFT